MCVCVCVCVCVCLCVCTMSGILHIAHYLRKRCRRMTCKMQDSSHTHIHTHTNASHTHVHACMNDVQDARQCTHTQVYTHTKMHILTSIMHTEINK